MWQSMVIFRGFFPSFFRGLSFAFLEPSVFFPYLHMFWLPLELRIHDQMIKLYTDMIMRGSRLKTFYKNEFKNQPIDQLCQICDRQNCPDQSQIINRFWNSPSTMGGGGGLLPYAYWVCAARETPIFSLNFRSGVYNFHKF